MRILVRLGFHDCISASCDGCIDEDADDNNGLAAVAAGLTPICSTHAMGLADCFAAAASMAMEEASAEGATEAQMPLFFGRPDATCCGPFTDAAPQGTFPSGQDGTYALCSC